MGDPCHSLYIPGARDVTSPLPPPGPPPAAAASSLLLVYGLPLLLLALLLSVLVVVVMAMVDGDGRWEVLWVWSQCDSIRNLTKNSKKDALK